VAVTQENMSVSEGCSQRIKFSRSTVKELPQRGRAEEPCLYFYPDI
jgi:hypothetical protein